MKSCLNRIPVKWRIFAGLFLAGAILRIFCHGYAFSGLFLMALSFLIPVYHFLGRIPRPGLRKGLIMLLSILLAVGFSLMAVTAGFIVHSAAGTKNPGSDYLIVLGAGVNGTVPSRSLQERLDAALDYLRAHPDSVAIVSGGMGPGEEITEAQCMESYLLNHGIPGERIWKEPEATSTLENLKFSRDLLEQELGYCPKTVAIVSSEYHLHRASMLARNLGLEPELIPAGTGIVPLRLNYYLREIFAVWYYGVFGGY